ncbi:helix-turn-helix domain-containing protein [Streptomyces sp. NPDC023838]|uniref:MmyB family transcriptional regulator n=1 Tax=Streptomyces sp. NPDC023838 TaxID=3154325 RepID=UPI0033E29EA4
MNREAAEPLRGLRTTGPAPTAPATAPATPTAPAAPQSARTGRSLRLQDFIRGRRDHLHLSQEDVAERLGLSCRAYGNWERGRVKEWAEPKLLALADALEMSDYQRERLFRLAVDRAPAPRPHTPDDRAPDRATTAYLADYAVMMDALSLPSLLIDHRWNVRSANRAYHDLFHEVGPHPTAMPDTNFLRFGLFHPDASTVLADLPNWRMSMLAQLASGLEQHERDPELRALRGDVHRHPGLRDLYAAALPRWVLDAGADLVHHEGPVHILRHPDPRTGLRVCRLLEESPKPLRPLGLTRITLVLTPLDCPIADTPRPRRRPPGVQGHRAA